MSGYRIILLCCLLLSGCQQWRYPADTGWVALDGGYYQLQDSWSGKPQQLVQQLSWHSGEQQQQFILTALLQPQGYLLIALSPLGHELWRLNYQQGHKLTVTGIAPFNQPQFARRLLAEMQLALLPMQQVAPHLRNLQVTQHQDIRYILRTDDSVLFTIADAEAKTPHQAIRFTADNYTLHITTLQQDLL